MEWPNIDEEAIGRDCYEAWLLSSLNSFEDLDLTIVLIGVAI
jgi:hypothetical protein